MELVWKWLSIFGVGGSAHIPFPSTAAADRAHACLPPRLPSIARTRTNTHTRTHARRRSVRPSGQKGDNGMMGERLQLSPRGHCQESYMYTHSESWPAVLPVALSRGRPHGCPAASHAGVHAARSGQGVARPSACCPWRKRNTALRDAAADQPSRSWS